MIWLKRYFTDLAGAHLDGLRTMRGLGWLFAFIIAWEFAQHVVEVRIGMYESEDAMRAVGNDPARMVMGWIKMILVYIGGFFTIRYLARTRQGTQLDPVGTAMARYLPYMAYMLGMFAALFYARSYVAEEHVDTVRAIIGLSQVFAEPLLMAWVVAAATDGSIKSPLISARSTGLLYFYALALFFVARLPVSLAHQALASAAIGKTGASLWGILALDAVVVGLIVAIIPAISVRVAALVQSRNQAAPVKVKGRVLGPPGLKGNAP